MSNEHNDSTDDAFDELDDALQEEIDMFEEMESEEEPDTETGVENLVSPDVSPEETQERKIDTAKSGVRISASQKDLEVLYAEFEKLKTEAKEKQDRAKEVKEEIIGIMDTLGKDEVIINGLDSIVLLSITYPEREVLNKKELAEELGIKQKELSKPETIIELSNAGKLTTEMIVKYTSIEERMQFSAKEYNPNEEDE